MSNTGKPPVGKSYPLYITGAATLPVNAYDKVVAILTGGVTLSLPALASCADGYTVVIRNNSAAPQTLTVQGNGSENIGSSNTASVTQNQRLEIMVDHVRTKWQILYGPA